MVLPDLYVPGIYVAVLAALAAFTLARLQHQLARRERRVVVTRRAA